jgi:membrane protein YdbS with pleckstrin-like domain
MGDLQTDLAELLIIAEYNLEEMKHVYRVTKANEWWNFKSILVLLISAILIAPIFFYFSSTDDFASYWFVIPIVFLCFFIPLCVIHLRYYSINDGMEMVFNVDERKVTIKTSRKNLISEFNLEDVKRVFHTMTPAMAEGRMYWFPWDRYNYSIIYLNNGEKYIITSLMVHKLELPVGSKYEVITSLYPYPK